MFSTIPARKLAEKVVAAVVISGALAVGTGGAAFAATTTTGVPHATHAKCARAPKALSKITKAQNAIATREAKLQADETKLVAAGHTKAAARVEKRITRLQKTDAKAGALASKIQAKCPAAVAS